MCFYFLIIQNSFSSGVSASKRRHRMAEETILMITSVMGPGINRLKANIRHTVVVHPAGMKTVPVYVKHDAALILGQNIQTMFLGCASGEITSCCRDGCEIHEAEK